MYGRVSRELEWGVAGRGQGARKEAHTSSATRLYGQQRERARKREEGRKEWKGGKKRGREGGRSGRKREGWMEREREIEKNMRHAKDTERGGLHIRDDPCRLSHNKAVERLPQLEQLLPSPSPPSKSTLAPPPNLSPPSPASLLPLPPSPASPPFSPPTSLLNVLCYW